MVRIVEGIQLLVLTVDCQRVLGQIIGPYAEEIHFFCKLTAHHNGSRCLNHDSQFHILTERDLCLTKLFFDLLDDHLDLLHFFYRNDHREHNGDLSVSRCPVQGTKLGLEDLRSCQADTDCPVSQCRVLFFVKSKVIHLLVCSDIQGTDNDLFACHIFCNLFVYLELLFFSREIFAFQIQELASEKSDPSCIIFKYGAHIGKITDIRIDIDLLSGKGDILFALQFFQKCFLSAVFFALFGHSLHGLFIRINVDGPGKAINGCHMSVIFFCKPFSQTNNGRDVHGPCKDCRMGIC